MSKFNQQKTGTKISTKENGTGYTKTPELELAQLLITSTLAGDKFYETEEETINRLKNLYNECNKKDITFFPKASIFARDKYHLRSISHLCSAIIADGINNGVYNNINTTSENGKSFLRNYFNKVIFRADDMAEAISAYFNMTDNKKLPHAMVRGFSDAQASYDEYTYAKYRLEGKEVSMVDVVRLTHPKVTEKNKVALEKLIQGNLKNTNTWEATVSNAGKSENKETATADAWAKFLNKDEKIEYMALLRNLNNILKVGNDELNKKAAELLCNEKLVKRSKVLPFRYLVAWKNLIKAPKCIMMALNKAAEISLSNVPKFSGKTCVIVDDSGSMSCGQVLQSINYFTIAMMFAAVLYKSNDADLVLFSDNARYKNLNPADSVITLATSLHPYGGWTNLPSAFEVLDKKYDRIIILSDFQTMGSSNTALGAYKRKFHCDPFVYSFDLSGYRASALPQGKSIPISGFSENSFDVMEKTEIDKNALVNEIKAIQI